MHCVQFEMRLNQLLDERRDPDSDLELVDHAGECPDCADLLSGQEMLRRGVELQRWNEASAGRDLAVRVAAEFTGRARNSSWRRWTWSIPTVAAAVLLALAVWHRVGGLNQSSPRDNSSTAKDGLPNIGLPGSHGGPAYDGLNLQTAAAWTQGLRARPPEWVEQMADGLKPVADSMSAALHGLRRTFSGAEPAVRSSQFEPPTLSRIGAIG